MKLITDSYRPVELYVITGKSKCQFIDMISLVLSDLLSNNVLAIDYHYVGQRLEAAKLRVGSVYNSYQSKPVDTIFLKPFMKNSNLVLQFKHALQISIQIAHNKHNMLRLVSRSENLKEILKYKNVFSVIGMVLLNNRGIRLSEQINRELVMVRQKLDGLILNAEPNQKEILNLLRNRYYFLKNYKTDDIFGTAAGTILKNYKSTGYDIHYELNLTYFIERLQFAHVELLQMEYVRDKYEPESYEDDWD